MWEGKKIKKSDKPARELGPKEKETSRLHLEQERGGSSEELLTCDLQGHHCSQQVLIVFQTVRGKHR